jgi:AraC-like DNA-binding protein
MNNENGRVEYLKPFPYPIEARRASFQRPTFKKHFHDSYSIGLVEAGASRFSWLHGSALLQPGDVVLLNPGEMHVCNPRPNCNWTYRMFYLAADWVEANLGPFEFTTSLVRLPGCAAGLCHLYDMLKQAGSCLESDECLIETLSHLFQQYGNRSDGHSAAPPPSSLQRVHDYLNEHYAESTSLLDLAGLAGLSQYHLLRSFREYYGLPPHSYQNLQRIEHAKTLLNGELPLVSIAASLGFSDQSHFNRVFKAVVGIPPGEYQLVVRR